MLRKVSVAALCVAIGSSLAFAAPEAKSDNRDLLAAASNNAVSQNNVGAQKLSKAEMEQVEGGMPKPKFPKVKIRCKGFLCIKF